MILFFALLSACSSQPEGASSLRFDQAEFQGVSTQLRGVTPGAQVPADVQRIAQEICPRLDRARFTLSDTPPMGILKLEGAELERVQSVGAVMADGTLGKSRPHHEQGFIEAAVGCSDCTILLAIEINEHKLACLGPGYSLTMSEGELVAP